MSPAASSKTLYLVDGTSQLFRAYYAISGLTNAEGLPTNAIYGFTTMLRKLLRDEQPSYVGVAFDLGRRVFRHEAYADYKANRPPAPEDLTIQVPYAKEICRALGLAILELGGYEADDLIATLAARARGAGFDVVIVASDKDLLQLVGQGVTVWNPSKDVRLDAAGVEAVFGVPPERVCDVLALMGDSVDNVPGVPGIGQKTALAAVATYGGLDAVLERAERFVAALDARDRLLAALDALKGAPASAPDAPVPEAAVALAAALSRLIEVERDAGLRLRLVAAERALDEVRSRVVGGRAGQPAGALFRSLAPLRRELKELDKGSGRRAWQAIRDHADRARLSKGLVALDSQAPVEFHPEALARGSGDPGAARQLYLALGFTSLVEEPEVVAGRPATQAGSRPVPYRAVFDAQALGELAEACRRAERLAVHVVPGPGVVAAGAPLVGLALCWSGGEAAYVPLGHRYLGAPDPLPAEQVRAALAGPLGDPGVAKVAHDLKRAIHALAACGLTVAGWSLDTRVAAFLLDAGRTSYPLGALAGELLGRDLADEAVGPEGPAGEPVERATERSAAAADAAWALAGKLRGSLEAAGLAALYDGVDGPLLPLLARMEAHGVRIDTERLARMSVELEVAIERARAEVHALAGVEFNLDSPKQLREVLFDRLGLAPRRKTAKSGAASTDAQTLEDLADEHAIASRLLEYRELAKLKGTYVDALPRLVDPGSGRVHTSFDPAGAATGRLSSSDPNLQNIPVRSEAGRRIRAAFVPDEGWRFLASDYSQIELRVLAHLAEDPALIAAFRSGEDVHRRTAAIISGVHPDLVTDEMRRRAKAINFGILYGMSEARLAREQSIPRADARRFIQAYFERFARVGAYIEAVREQALRDGEVRTLFGRRRSFPVLRQRANRAAREQALRGAVNTTIQGTAADLMKLAMLAVDRALSGAGLRSRILLQVHDELLIEVPAEELESAAGLVRTAMEGVGGLCVPLVVEQGSGASWLEAK
jgi:DNA polymerase-1